MRPEIIFERKESEVAQSCPTLCDPVDPCQAPLSMGFSRQEYWSGLPFPSPEDLPNPGIKPRSPALQADALSSEAPGKPTWIAWSPPKQWTLVETACVLSGFSHVQVFATSWTAAHQASLSFNTSRNLLKLRSVEFLMHPTISSSVLHFSFCLQSFPASRSVPVSHFFTSGSQSIGVSASASILPANIQDWFPLGLTCLISLPSKGLSRVFSNTTVQKHQFFGAQLSLWSNSHIHTWLLEKP